MPGIVIALVSVVAPTAMDQVVSGPGDARDRSRECFCAHAIFGAPSMVAAFEDLRVAENPFVTEPPHVRFSRVTRYAR